MGALHTDDLESAPCGFITFSDDGTILTVNTTLVSLLGYAGKEAMVGKSIEMMFTIAGRIFYQTHFFPLITLHGKANEIFFKLRMADGGDLPVMCNAVRKERNSVFTNHCILMPVAERGRYEQQLLDARRQAELALKENTGLAEAKKALETRSIDLDRQISRLKQMNSDIVGVSKIISHDLQEPIRKIAVFADRTVMEAKNLLAADTVKNLERVNAECVRLRRLATDLERFISLNIRTEDIVLVDLDEVLHTAYKKVAALSTGAYIALAAEKLPAIEGYKGQLHLLFQNVFEHRIEHRGNVSAQHITVECSIVQQNSFRTIEGSYYYTDLVKIMIADNGSDHDNDRVFLLQQQKGLGSTGFGLAFSKTIVDNHYGSITTGISVTGANLITIMLPLQQRPDLLSAEIPNWPFP